MGSGNRSPDILFVFAFFLITFALMKQKEYIIYVEEGYEMKTSQMLSMLHIEHKLPLEKIKLNGIQHFALSKNGIIHASIEPKEIEKVLSLPYVIDIALANKD